MYDSIDTILCVYLNICSFCLQICVQYCIDVVAVVEINSIQFNIAKEIWPIISITETLANVAMDIYHIYS